MISKQRRFLWSFGTLIGFGLTALASCQDASPPVKDSSPATLSSEDLENVTPMTQKAPMRSPVSREHQ